MGEKRVARFLPKDEIAKHHSIAWVDYSEDNLISATKSKEFIVRVFGR